MRLHHCKLYGIFLGDLFILAYAMLILGALRVPMEMFRVHSRAQYAIVMTQPGKRAERGCALGWVVCSNAIENSIDVHCTALGLPV